MGPTGPFNHLRSTMSGVGLEMDMNIYKLSCVDPVGEATEDERMVKDPQSCSWTPTPRSLLPTLSEQSGLWEDASISEEVIEEVFLTTAPSTLPASLICGPVLALENILSLFSQDVVASSGLLCSGLHSSMSYESFQVLVCLASLPFSGLHWDLRMASPYLSRYELAKNHLCPTPAPQSRSTSSLSAIYS